MLASAQDSSALSGIDPRPSWGRRPVGGESGFTVIELVVAGALLFVVLGAILGVLETTQRLAPKDVERNAALHEGQVGLYRMTRELRQGTPPAGTPLPTSASNSVDVVVGSLRVRYACDVDSATAGFRRCVRYSSTNLTAPPGGTGETVIDRVVNGTATDPVFYPSTGSSGVNYFEAKVKLPARGELKTNQGYRYTIVLDDGFYLRNVGS